MTTTTQLLHASSRQWIWYEVFFILLVWVKPKKEIWAGSLAVLFFLFFKRYPNVSMAELGFVLVNLHWAWRNIVRPAEFFTSGPYYLVPGSIFLISAIHKLNDSFFSATQSCIKVLMPFVASIPLPWIFIPSVLVMSYVFIGVSSFTKYRRWGWGLMFIIQSIIAFRGIWDFSVVLWGGVLSCMIEEDWAKYQRYVYVMLFGHLLSMILFQQQAFNRWRIFFGALTVVAMAAPFFMQLLRAREQTKPVSRWEFGLLSMFFISCLSPYWGGGQHNVFSMFSNLQISPFFSNSWLPHVAAAIPKDDWIVLESPPVITPQAMGATHISKWDLVHWKSDESALYLPVYLGKNLLRDGVTVHFTHGGQKWDWPGNASDWKMTAKPISRFARKAVSNGHCQQ